MWIAALFAMALTVLSDAAMAVLLWSSGALPWREMRVR
jgi:hypothetical protein